MRDSSVGKKNPIEQVQRPRTSKAKLEPVSHDITENIKIPDGLKGLTRSIMENAYIAVSLVDRNHKILMVNRAMSRIFRKPATEFIGRDCFREFEKRKSVCPHCPGKRAMETGQPTEAETEGFRDDGSRLAICIQAFPTTDRDGSVTGFIEIIEDISEQKKVEQALRQSEQKYKDIFENAREAIITIDLKGNITDANKLVEEYGFKREELIGKNHFEFIVEKYRAEAIKGFERLVHGDIVEGEIELITPKGNIIVEYRDNPILWEGQIIGVQAILTDITERKKVEEELQRQKEELQVILDSVPASILYKDKENHFIRVNKICADLLGRPIEKIEGKSCFELFPPDQAEAYWRDDKEVIASGHPKRKIIEPVETPEGTRLVQTDKIPYRNGKGNVIGVIGFAIDITERKRAEKALRESEEKFKGIFEHANDGVIYLDGSGKILDVNRKAIQIFGVSKKQVLNKHFITQLGIFPADQIPTLMSSFERILDGKEVILTVSIKNKEGKEIILECSASLATTNGQTSNIMVIARDITERQKAAEQIAKLAKFPAEDPNPVLRISAFGTVIYGNKASLPLLKTWQCRVGQSLPDRWHRLVLDALISGQSEQTEFQCDGRTFSLIFAPVLNANYVNIYGLDITELKEVEKQLLQNQAQLRTLASKLSLTEERERRRIASELHDQIGQSLAVSKIKLEALRKSCSYKDKEAEKNFDEICETLGQAIVDMRSLIFDLSSPILHELGFGKAVMECLIEQIEKKHAIQTEFEDDDLPKPLDDDVQSILFRNVRELLINVVKYARANKVKVSIRRIDTQIQIIVEDDGIGFNVQEMTKTATGMGGFGLFSIQEGLDHLGGHIALESEPGHGCKVTMTAPLKL
jgi:PAS domain S-box-containing protein